MANLWSRWLRMRTIDRCSEARASMSPSDESDLTAQIMQLERRLRREAELDREIPSRALRTRTMNALHDAALYDAPRSRWRYRRRAIWWRTPQFKAALTACGVVIASALVATLMFSDPPRHVVDAGHASEPSPHAQPREDSRYLAQQPAPRESEGEDSPDDILMVLGASFQAELDAVASDARRAADFIVSQFPLRQLIPPDVSTKANRQPLGKPDESNDLPPLDL